MIQEHFSLDASSGEYACLFINFFHTLRIQWVKQLPKAGKLESLRDSETFAFTLSSTSSLHLENGRLRVSPRKRQEQGQGNAVDVTEGGSGNRGQTDRGPRCLGSSLGSPKWWALEKRSLTGSSHLTDGNKNCLMHWGCGGWGGFIFFLKTWNEYLTHTVTG